jgi:carboxymethylenebutenolidase
MKQRPKVNLEDIDYMQRYLGVEMYEMYRDGLLSRRTMLRRLVTICGGGAAAAAVLASCEDDTVAGLTDASAPPSTGGADAGAGAGARDGGAEGPAGAAADAAAPDAGARPDAAPAPSGDARPAGVLSVPPGDPSVMGMNITYRGDVDLLGYLARPQAMAARRFGVVVIHENQGLTDHIRDVARRLAKAGFVALAVDLASRGGGTGNVAMVGQFLSDPARRPDLIKDIGASLDHLGRQPGVVADKYGVVGFCYGGGMTWQAAANHAKVAAAVPYYGPAPNPLDIMKMTNAAIFAHYADNDMNVNGANQATIMAMERTLKDAGKTFEWKLHPGALHGFNNDTGARYNEAAAVAAWTTTLDWFRKHLT